MKNNVSVALASLLCLYFLHGNCLPGLPGTAFAQDDWKQEFAVVCSKTQNAMTLSFEELQDFIDRCDKLEARINALDDGKAATEKKVYSKRVKMCKDFYSFVLQQKDAKE